MNWKKGTPAMPFAVIEIKLWDVPSAVTHEASEALIEVVENMKAQLDDFLTAVNAPGLEFRTEN